MTDEMAYAFKTQRMSSLGSGIEMKQENCLNITKLQQQEKDTPQEAKDSHCKQILTIQLHPITITYTPNFLSRPRAILNQAIECFPTKHPTTSAPPCIWAARMGFKFASAPFSATIAASRRVTDVVCACGSAEAGRWGGGAYLVPDL